MKFNIQLTVSNKFLVVILYALSVVIATQGQTPALQSANHIARIRVKANIKKDHISLRWAVDQPTTWQQANSIGFILKRYTLVRDDNALPIPEAKELGHFMPISQEKWAEISQTNDNAAIIAQALYGEVFEVEIGGKKSTIEKIINKSQDLEQRFSFALMAADLDFSAACLAGWGYTDKDVKPNERYLYTVEIAEDKTKRTPLQIEGKGRAIAATSMMEELPKPLGLIAIFKDKTAILTWEYTQQSDIYTAYDLEKSDNGIHFELVNKQPIVSMNTRNDNAARGMIYMDSLVNNNTTYTYRVRGRNIFGEFGPYSDVVSGEGKKSPEATPYLSDFNILPNQTIHLRWEYPQSAEADIVSFELLHSETDNKDSYKRIKTQIPVTAREITTQNLSPANYFKIKAMGKNGESRESFALLVQLNDSTPPAIPTGLRGEIDSLGTVRLTWNPNTEKDLEGYHVFRATQKSEDLVRLTSQSASDAFFTDTVKLESLNPKVYYAVISVDRRKNESKTSTLLELEKPDRVRPQTPVFTNYEMRNDGILLQWQRSYSSDVVVHKLYRQSVGDQNAHWQIIYETTELKPIYDFLDKVVETNKQYRYFLVAIDKNNLQSDASREITIRYISSKTEKIITNLTSLANKDKKRIELNWQITAIENQVSEIIIYKQVNSEQPTMWKTLRGAQNFLEDTTVQEGNQYTYWIKVMLRSNRPSKTEKTAIKY